MSDYNCSIVIAAPAAAVHAALTTREGLQGWWTTTCEVGTHVGALSMFRFGETYHKMRIDRLQPCEIRWHCLEQYYHAPGQLTRSDEWVGTTLIFRLLPQTAAKTLLEFEHVGLEPELDVYTISEKAWNHFLRRSLRQFLETGNGEPYRNGG
jgi:uncharacterized protein YndB with AHSA1/START domain